MWHQPVSIRPFIGAKDFDRSSAFYKDLGFNETVLSPVLSVFISGSTAFYLQRAYVKDWVDNTMLFWEVSDVHDFWKHLLALHLTEKYPEIKLSPVRANDWGSECFIHDPSGILWHVGSFNQRAE